MNPRYQGPEIVELGVASTLTLDVWDAGSQQTATAATVTVQDGSETLVSAAAATSLGPPATYTLLAAATSGRTYSDRGLVIWSMTIGGLPYTFQRRLKIVRRKFYRTVVTQDLLDLYPTLELFFTTDKTDFETELQRAEDRIERALVRKGRRPELIFDPDDLAEAFEHAALALVYRWGYSALGDTRYDELATFHDRRFTEEMDGLAFSFDVGETGTIDTSDLESGEPLMVLTAGPAGGGWRSR